MDGLITEMVALRSLCFLNDKNQWTQKEIQKVVEERGLWPAKGQNSSCPKPKCFNCQVAADCKICVKGHKCDTYKALRECSSTNCLKSRHVYGDKKFVNV